ncbi:MFS transporter [Paenibacillus sp. MBLB2552]|uniref:MFS transporter n=1 Tax=Paenibacillus mellifer TaxID=2937794 RepID=A0A9X2BSV0_9BACL|nr:MFS transporter [Paenibacillus mellifer]MCK8488780.1 MFS transporter [Paenibacillus mellifer]
MSSLRILRQEPSYRRLFAAGLVNGIGDRFSQVAILGLLLSLTGSGLAVGITFAVRLFPYLVFGPLGGLLADRFSKKTIMIFTDVIRMFFALTPLLVRTPGDVWIIYVSAFALSAGEAIYAPARMSLIPRLVRRDNLLAVNSLEQAMVGFVLIGGSVTGGILAAAVGGQVSFALNALSFLISGLLLFRLDLAGRPEAAEPDTDKSKPTLAPRQTAGLRRLVTQSYFLRIMLIVFAIWPIGDGIFNVLISVYAAEVFHTGDIGIGLLYGALGAGMLIGSGFTGKMARYMRTAAVLTVLIEGGFQVMISQSPSFLLLLLLLALSAAITSVGNACNETVLMQLVPTEWQGRFFGGLATLQNTLMGIAMLSAGFMLEVVTPRALGLTGGVFLALLGLSVSLAWLLHRPRTFERRSLSDSEKTTLSP